MATVAPAATTSARDASCTAWFASKFSERTRNALKVTAFIVSLLILTIAVIATLVSTGVLNETFSLYSLGNIGQLASGILLTLSFISTVVLGFLLGRDFKEHFCNKEDDGAVAEAEIKKVNDNTGKKKLEGYHF